MGDRVKIGLFVVGVLYQCFLQLGNIRDEYENGLHLIIQLHVLFSPLRLSIALQGESRRCLRMSKWSSDSRKWQDK